MSKARDIKEEFGQVILLVLRKRTCGKYLSDAYNCQDEEIKNPRRESKEQLFIRYFMK